MNIECHNCGTKINLDQSLKTSLLSNEIESIKAEIMLAHKNELDKQKKQFKKILDDNTSKIRTNYEMEIEQIKIDRNKIKEAEIQAKMEKIELEDQIKEAKIKANEESRALFKQKEKQLMDENKRFQETIKSRLELELLEKEKLLLSESQSLLNEKDLEIKRLMNEAENARSKLNYAKNSQELVGEAAELLLLERLKSNFELDKFEEIKKGQQGADICQKVCTKAGEVAGTILYESKKTKNWSEGWVAKFKDDIRKKGASIGILVSEALPKYCQDIVYKNGIWITSPRFVLFVAAACCKEIHSLHKAKAVKKRKSSLEGAVYDYITSDDFIERFRTLAETLCEQLNDLEREQKAFQKLWRARRIHIDKSQISLVEIFGDLETLSEGNIKPVEEFQLSIS